MERHTQALANEEGGKLTYAAREALLNVARAPTYLESRGVPSTFTGDTAEQIAPELAEVEWELAIAKRD